MTAEADVTAEVAGNATQFRFKDSEGNKAKGEFVFDKSGELYVKVKTYERGDGSLTYPKTESIMTRQEPSLEVSENSEEDASYNESNEVPMNRNPTAKAVKILLMRIQKNMRFPTEKKKPIIRNDQKIKHGKIKNPRILAIRESRYRNSRNCSTFPGISLFDHFLRSVRPTR